jgi:hypothetical protein
MKRAPHPLGTSGPELQDLALRRVPACPYGRTIPEGPVCAGAGYQGRRLHRDWASTVTRWVGATTRTMGPDERAGAPGRSGLGEAGGAPLGTLRRAPRSMAPRDGRERRVARFRRAARGCGTDRSPAWGFSSPPGSKAARRSRRAARARARTGPGSHGRTPVLPRQATPGRAVGVRGPSGGHSSGRPPALAVESVRPRGAQA